MAPTTHFCCGHDVRSRPTDSSDWSKLGTLKSRPRLLFLGLSRREILTMRAEMQSSVYKAQAWNCHRECLSNSDRSACMVGLLHRYSDCRREDYILRPGDCAWLAAGSAAMPAARGGQRETICR